MQVHRAELPLLHRIQYPHHEAKLLFLVGDRKPVLDDLDPGPGQHAFEFRHVPEKLLDLFLRGEIHHAFDACAVVPGPVEQHDFTGGGKMRHVALEIPLRFFAFGWRTQRDRAADARVQPLRYPLDHTTFAGGIAAFEQHHQFETVGDDPVLKGDQFTLQTDQFAKIGAAVQCRSLIWSAILG